MSTISQRQMRAILVRVVHLAVIVSLVFSPFPFDYFAGFGSTIAEAAFNQEINYQGKLTDGSNVAVPDGYYNMEFKLYTVPTGGSPIWTETWCKGAACSGTGNDGRVQVTSGLFSTLLGSTTSLASVDFDQILYLGVNIGGSGNTPSWDGEMTPRKRLGAVPAAFVAKNAQQLNNLGSGQFLRSDAANSTSTSSTFVTIAQSGAGDALVVDGQNSTRALTVQSTGRVGIGTSSPYGKLAVAGDIIASYFTATTTTATSSFAGGLSVLGSTGLNVLQNGNIGIGTATPSQLLEVVKNQNANTRIDLVNTDSGASAQAIFVARNATYMANYGMTGGSYGGYGSVGASTAYLYSNSPAGIAFIADNASGVIQFITGGNTEKMRLSAAGYLGIGTTSPTFPLDVNGVIRTIDDLTVGGGDINLTNGTSNRILFGQSGVAAPGVSSAGMKLKLYGTIGAMGSTDYAIGIEANNMWFNTDQGYKWYEDSAQTMALIGGGLLGIGTTTPGNRLSVQGGANISGDLSVAGLNATGTVRIGSLTGPLQAISGVVSATSTISPVFGGTGLSTLPSYGQLLLGNASGGYTLTATSSLGLGSGFFAQGGNSFGTAATLGTNDSNALVFETAGTERARFDTSGNFGIGTTTPVGNGLTISAATTPQLTFADQSLAAGNKNFLMRLNPNIGTGVFQIGSAVDAGSANVMNLSLDRSGFVGVGTTSPARQLDVWGSASIASSANDASVQLGGTSNAPFIQGANTANTSSKSLILQPSGGNIGIGTTTPGNRLSVQGGANISGDLSVAGLNATGTVRIGSLTGPLQAISGVVSATSTISPVFGGTGLSTLPSYGQLLLGNASGGYTLTATSSLGLLGTSAIGTGTQGQVPFYNSAGSALTATSSLFIAQSGNVGVGSTSPMGRFSVVTSSIAGRYVTMGDGTASTNVFTARADDNGLSYISLQNLDPGATTNHGIGIRSFFGTDSSENPILAGRSDFIKEQTWTSTASTQDSAFLLHTTQDGASSEKLRVTSAGNVGIGTSTPGTRLHIADSTSRTTLVDNNGQLRIDGLASDGQYRSLLFGDVGGNPIAKISVERNTLGSQFRFLSSVNYAAGITNEIMSLLQNGNLGLGSTTPNWKLSVNGSGSFDGFARASFFTATSTTASTFPYASTTALTVSGTNGLSLGSLTGPLQALNGAVSATSTISPVFGGTGLSTLPSYGQLLLGNSSGGYTLTATSSLGLLGTSAIGAGTQGQFPFYNSAGSALTATSSLFIAQSGNVGIGTVIPASSLHVNYAGGAGAELRLTRSDTSTTFRITPYQNGVETYINTSMSRFGIAANDGSGSIWLRSAGVVVTDATNSQDVGFARNSAGVLRITDGSSGYGTLLASTIGIGTTTPGNRLSVQGGANISGDLSVAGLNATGTVRIGSLTGPLQAISGVVSATSTISPVFGGTGLSTLPSYGQLLLGNSSGGYTLTATSSLGLATFAYPFPSSATSSLLAFNGGLTSYASTTIGAGAQATGLTVSGGATTTGNAYFGGTIGVGTTVPAKTLSVNGDFYATGSAIAGRVLSGSNSTALGMNLFDYQTSDTSAFTNTWFNRVINPGSSMFTSGGSVPNLNAYLTFAGSGGSTASTIQNINSQIDNTNSSTTNQLVGIRSNFNNNTGVGTTTTMANFMSFNTLSSGRLEYSINYYAAPLNPAAPHTGSIGTSYGFYSPGLKTASTTSAYGIHIAGANDLNYIQGNLGMNDLSPQSLLSVSGGVNIGAAGGAFDTAAPTYGMIVQGNVGIGTTSPYAKLAVAGEVVASHLTATSSVATSSVANTLTVGLQASTSAATANLIVRSDGQKRGAILITGQGTYTGGPDTNNAGTIIFPGWNQALQNKQLIVGASEDWMSSTKSGFRYITGYNIPMIDGVTMDGLTRTNISLGFTDNNVGFGFDITTAANADIAGKVHVRGETSGSEPIQIIQNMGGTGNYFQIRNSAGTVLSAWDNSNNLGIGTSSPYTRLSVSGSAAIDGNVRSSFFVATSTTASTFPYASTTALTVSGTNGLSLGSLTGPLQALNGAVSATSTISPVFGGTGLSTLPSYGQLLLGNSSGGYTLTATSSLGLGSGFFAQGGNSFGALATLGTNDSNALSFETAGTERARFDTSGRFGIGTTSPLSTLTVDSPGTGGGGYVGLREHFTISSFAPNIWLEDESSGATDYFIFLNDSNFTIGRDAGSTISTDFVMSGGNVGLGTTTPSEALTVVKTSGTEVAEFYNTQNHSEVVINTPSTYNAGLFLSENGARKFGLIYNANLTSGDRAPDNFELYSYTSSAPVLRISESASNALTIDSSGKAGFGTTSPRGYIHIANNGDATTPSLVIGTDGSSPYGATLYYDDINNRLTYGSTGSTYWGLGYDYFTNMYGNGGALATGVNGGPTETTPTILPNNNDQNTGIGQVGVDSLTLITGGTGVFRVSAASTSVTTGNFGIGTSTPGAKLAINNTTGFDSLLITDTTDPDPTPFRIDQNGRMFLNASTSMSTTTRFGETPDLHIRTANNTGAVTDGITLLGAGNNRKVSFFGNQLQVDFSNSGTPAGLNLMPVVGQLNGVGIGTTTNSWPGYLTVQGTTTSSAQATLATFNSAGVRTFTIQDGGNVGIGTSTPSTTLEINAVTPVLQISNSNTIISTGATYGDIDFYSSDLTAQGVMARIRAKTNDQNVGGDGELAFWTMAGGGSLTEKMRLTTVGRLGVGTTTPSAFVHITNTSSAESFRVEDSASVDSSPFVIDATGNVGIGTSTPVGNGLTISAASVPQLTFADQSLSAGNKNFFMRINPNISTGIFQIGSAVDGGSASAVGINISRTGLVGMGTTSPARQLDVWGSASFASAANDASVQISSASNVPFIQGANTANTATRSLILQYSGGNVGIGTTTPANKLHIYRGAGGGSLGDSSNDVLIVENNLSAGINLITPTTASGGIFFSDSTRAVGRINYDHSTDAMSLWTASGERLRIDSSGNVGIGTTTPAGKFAVTYDTGSTDRREFWVANGVGAVIRYDDNSNTPILQMKNLSTFASSTFGARQRWALSSNVGGSVTEIIAAELGVIRTQDWSDTSTTNTSAMTFATRNGSGGLAERMRILPGGSVAIGTTTTNVPGLHVKQTNNGGDVALWVQNNDTNSASTASLNFTITTNDSYKGAFIRAVRTPTNDLLFGTNEAEGFRLTGNQRLMFGTTTDSYSAKMMITGGTSATAGALEITPSASSNRTLKIVDNDLSVFTTNARSQSTATDLFIQSSTSAGEVAIGTTTSPSAKLSVAAPTGVVGMIVDGGGSGVDIAQFNRNISSNVTVAISGGGGLPQVKFGTTAGYVNSIFYDPNTGTLRIATSTTNVVAGAEPIIIKNSTGFVGIGTSSPSDKLHVEGDIRVGTGTTGCVKDADGTTISGTCSSDINLKKNITSIGKTIGKLSEIDIVNYNWKSDEFPEYHFGSSTQIGVIAQNVEAQFPELVSVDRFGYKQVNYSALPLLAIQAVKDFVNVIDVRNATSVSPSLTVTADGRIGMGTSTPSYKLHVMGDAAATAFINISTRESKKDITYLEATEKNDMMAKVRSLKLAKYHYKQEDGSSPMRIGLIAEETPAEVLSVDGKGVDLYKLTSMVLAGVQIQDERLSLVENKVADLENRLNLLGGVASTTVQIDPITSATTASAIEGYLNNFGVKITSTLAQFKSVAADIFTAKQVKVEEGITLKDRNSGIYYCVTIENGEMKYVSGDCMHVLDGQNSPTVNQPAPAPSEAPAVPEVTTPNTETGSASTTPSVPTTGNEAPTTASTTPSIPVESESGSEPVTESAPVSVEEPAPASEPVESPTPEEVTTN